MQELVWAGVKVAVLSASHDADSGSHLGKSRVPVGCVHIASQVSNLPAALRCGICSSLLAGCLGSSPFIMLTAMCMQGRRWQAWNSALSCTGALGSGLGLYWNRT